MSRCSKKEKTTTNNNKKKEGKWGINGGIETYLIGERDESCRKTVSEFLSIPKGSGAAAAPSWILHDNGSKSRKL